MSKQTEELKLALNKAFQLGKRYWSWADSEYSSHWKKADAAKAEFDQLVQDTINAALAEQPAQQQEPVAAAKKDAVFSASIEFIGTLTGMKPPPIEVAPPEILKPFRDFTENVCSIFAAPQPAQQEPVAYTNGEEIILAKHWTASEPPTGWLKLVFPTSPPAQRTWVGLTDEERMECFNSAEWNDLMQYAEVIEAKLREKNA